VQIQWLKDAAPFDAGLCPLGRLLAPPPRMV